MPAARDRSNGKYVRGVEAAPALGEVSPQQGFYLPPQLGVFPIVGNLDTYAAGNAGNPCGFPGWGSLYRGSLRTYDWMLNHPIIAHARSIIFDACISGTWSVKFDKNDPPPQQWIDLVTDQFLSRRQEFYADTLRGLDYGYAPFEKVWELRDGLYWLQKLKPLLWEWTTVVTEKTGDFAGLSQGFWANNPTQVGVGVDGKPVAALNPYKSFQYVHDMRAGNWYGRARLENLREYAWRDWLDCAQQIHRLGNRLCGIYLIGYAPRGDTVDPATGKKVEYAQAMHNSIQRMVNGDPAMVITNLSLEVDDPEERAKLAAASLVHVDKLDFGSLSPAVDGLIRRQVHNEELMFHGMLRSPRVGSESKHGSRADAEEHTATGDKDSQLICWSIDRQTNQRGGVDDSLVLNFGERARGKVWFETAPLEDTTPDRSLKFLGIAMQSNKGVAARAADVADVRQALVDAKMPVTDKTWDETQAAGAAANALPDPNADPNNPDNQNQ